MHVSAPDTDMTGYNHQNNDNYNQRGKVYCYLKATPEAQGSDAALGELKRVASGWAKEEEGEGEGESSGARGKKPKRIPWGDKAAELAKAQARSPPDL